MTRTINVEKVNKIKKAIPRIEEKTKIKLATNKNTIIIDGSELNEYFVQNILKAIDFGFDVEDALLLKNEEFNLKFINIKSNTRRKNLKDVRARVIGVQGKAKKTIENLTGAVVVINNNTVGVIVDYEHLDSTIQAIESLIRGAKHGNVFAYIEKQNKEFYKYNPDDLGLTDRAKKIIKG